MTRFFLLAALVLALGAGCEKKKEPLSASGPPLRPADPAALSEAASSAPSRTPPPAPPFLEDFEAAPRISLFPRLGDYRPENDDEVALPYWRTYLEHVTRTSGVVQLPPPLPRGRVFSFRGVAGLSSIGFFSPVAVEPGSTYRVSALFKAELPEGASAGLGILEFDEFLWVAEQYPRTLDALHRTGSREGVRLTGRTDWQERAFAFTAGPKTRMVHLVLFREGAADRAPVLVDDIRMEKAQP